MKYKNITFLFLSFLILQTSFAQEELKLNDLEYFEMPGLNVTFFSDYYPEGHQSGVTIIQHGMRVAANGDLRLEASPGQWSPVPKGGKRTVHEEEQSITQTLWYPDSSKNRKGFNPVIYPDLRFTYEVKVEALEGSSFKVTVDFEEPIPHEWTGKIGFNLELFPGDLFGKSFLMDGESVLFPIQPNGPIVKHNKEYLAVPLATGNQLVIAPESDKQRVKIETKAASLELWDGRANHNNGWFIVRSIVPPNTTDNAIEWVITPHVIDGWEYTPVIHVSQFGYHTDQEKKVLIEQDKSDAETSPITIYRLNEHGREAVKSGHPEYWGQFLRYNYLQFDFSDVDEGMYVIGYRDYESNPFRVANDVFERHAWQPTLEYYLPVQMCHMRINEKYRVWHGACHLDDALMAPTDHNHFDGYIQGASTLTKYESMEHVPGLNKGGWHDAGDYDLRVESQIGTVLMLALMVEEFGLDYDATLIDQENRLVEIHVPDGKSDALQQIEHGLLTVLGGYRALGRLYRGIICQDLRQYVLLGDGSTMTDNLVYNPALGKNEVVDRQSGANDDRYVFTEENPRRELYVAAGLAAASRVLKESNPDLSEECLTVARSLYDRNRETDRPGSKIQALAELILTTDDPSLKSELTGMKDVVIENIGRSGWVLGRVMERIDDSNFKSDISDAVADYQEQLREEAKNSPFGVPYEPNIWGAGWTIQRFGVHQYFFYKGWPEHTSQDFFLNALNFVLGVHPGENTSSFASGVGSRSVTVAYGVNRADWSFIPGGVASGTALIRPDLPEMKIWPFFWQQTEYVMGGGATNYMFLALAAENHFKKE